MQVISCRQKDSNGLVHHGPLFVCVECFGEVRQPLLDIRCESYVKIFLVKSRLMTQTLNDANLATTTTAIDGPR